MLNRFSNYIVIILFSDRVHFHLLRIITQLYLRKYENRAIGASQSGPNFSVFNFSGPNFFFDSEDKLIE